MAKKFLTAIDLAKNELQNASVQNLASAPASPVKGQLYFNTTDSTLYWCENNVGPVWVPAKATGGAFPGYGSVLAETTYGIARSDGAGSTVARADHTHGSPSLGTTPSTQAIGDSAAGGSATDAAKTDHKHAMPAFGNVVASTAFGQASANGSGPAVARFDHVHGTPTHDAAAHSAIPLSALSAATAGISMGDFVIGSVGAPSLGSDAANKTYVDNMGAGLSWKEACRIATTANITQASLAAVDGVTPVANDRILCKDQSTGAQNGIWLAQSGAWTRALDADAAGEMEGAVCFVLEGTVNADKAFVCTTNAPITIGTTPLVWVQFGAGATYTAGAGLTLTANDLAVGAGTGIVVAADTVALDTTYLGTNYASSARTVTAGNGLTGGGDLTANRTFDVGAGTGITVAADTVALDTTYTDTRYVNVTGDTMSGQLLLTPVDDATLTSTLHAFQIGPTSGQNLRMDNNEIQQVNNGVAASLSINANGGQIITGGGGITTTGGLSTSKATIPVALTAQAYPFQVGPSAGLNMIADYAGAIQARNNGVASTLALNPLGGQVTLPADPSAALGVATKQYVDTKTGKFAQDCAAAATTTVTHNLNTYDVEVVVFTNSGVRDDVEVDVERPTVNSVLVRFTGTAPTAGQYRIVVHG